MAITVDIIDNSDQVRAELQDKLSVALEKIGLAGEAFAKEEITAAVYDTPESRSGYKRTGRLRNSLTHTTDSDSAYIATNVEYAAYVELGTSKMAARPYLKPAVMNHQDEYKQIVESVMKG